MNVCLFSMGLGVYSVQLAQGLGEKDHVIVGLDYNDMNTLRAEHTRFFDNSMFEIFATHKYNFPDIKKIIEAFSIFRTIIKSRPDVVHVSISGIYPEAFFALWLAKKSGIPIVATVHDVRLHPGDSIPKHSILLSFMTLALCSQVIVHGRHMAEDLVNIYGIDERLINIIPHGNYDIFLHTNNNSYFKIPKAGQVLFFGRMKKYKGLDVLIRAAPIVAEKVKNLKIIIAGKGKELDIFEPQLKRNCFFEIRNRYIPANEVAELFASSYLVVIPYIEGSQSGPLHIAYTWGVPVVATRVGAIPESLKDRQEGILVPPNDPQALAVAMIEILKCHDLALRLGNSGRKKADTELNWAGQISEKTRSVYRKAIDLKGKAAIYRFVDSKARWKKFKDL